MAREAWLVRPSGGMLLISGRLIPNMVIGALAPVVLLDFFDSLGIIVVILDFILVYRLFYPSLVGSQVLGIALAAMVTFMLILPYGWFAWLIFICLFLYSFFWNMGGA